VIRTGFPCLQCGREIVRNRNHHDSRDKLQFCGNSCRATWCNQGKNRGNQHTTQPLLALMAVNLAYAVLP
jgi:hypothetical protein